MPHREGCSASLRLVGAPLVLIPAWRELELALEGGKTQITKMTVIVGWVRELPEKDFEAEVQPSCFGKNVLSIISPA